MKKSISIFTALCLCMVAAAQDAFYYYRGNKLQLTESPRKVVIISSLSNAGVPAYTGLSMVETIDDSRNRICVYETSPSQTVSQVRAAVSLTGNNVTLQSCFINAAGEELIPSGYINVKLKNESDYAVLADMAEQYDLEIVGQNEFMPLWYSLRQTKASGLPAVDIANNLYESGKFEYASPDFVFDAREFSYDPDLNLQWSLYNSEYEGLDISVSPAWNYATGRGIIIAIIDEGIEKTHQDLAENIYHLSYDTETGTSPSKVYQTDGHGTHCAGIAAAVRNNGIQIAGVAPDAQLMSVSNMLNNANTAKEMADGINWAWRNGADVISCSWKCGESELVEEAIDAAVTKGREGKGCVFVKSAGNTFGAISFPGYYRKEVLAVANMTENGSLSASSAHGANMFITAPGTNIWSTVLNNSLGKMSGTSMAAPHVAGVAALILERNPKLKAEKVREIMARNAKKIGTYGYDTTKEFGSWNEYYGYGLVDAYESVLNTPRY